MSHQIKINAKDHKVTGVTVYQTDRAVIQRRFPVDLKDGQNEVSISRLPIVLEGDSLRVEVETKSASHGLTVFDVVHIPPSHDRTRRYDAGSELEELNEKVSALNARLAVLEKQEAILGSFGDSLQATKDDTGGSSVTTLESFLDVYSFRHGQIYEETQRIEKEKAEANARIREIQQKQHSEQEASRSTGVSVVLLAEEDGPAELILSYVVQKASWSSLYDVRADLTSHSASGKDSSGPTIALQYRANIAQSTGEDWDGVVLTLSTASPLLGSDIPVLRPWKIGQLRAIPAAPYPPRAVALSAPLAVNRTKSRSKRNFKQVAASTEDFFLEEDEEDKAYVGGSGPKIAVSEGAISSTFEIDGLSTIPSDSTSHKVSIAIIDLVADLEWVTVPRTIPSAFLQCRIKNTSSYQLIAGPSNVFMDGNFVSKSRVPDVAPQETFSCSLGVDPSVRITYHPVKKVKSTSGSGFMSTKTNTTSFRQRITVKNARQTRIARLVVKDHVPLSEDARIKVTVTQPSEKALGPAVPSSSTATTSSTIGSSGVIGETLTAQVQKNVIARWAQKDEENGGSGGSREDAVLEWIGTDVKDTLELELTYEVVAPADLAWTNV